jgi:hypothetical protein
MNIKVIARAACLSCFASMLCLAGDWSGWLVSAKCFASMNDNRNDVERAWDANLVVRYCTPDKDTKSFVLMRNDGAPYKFDSDGNEEAAELPLSAGKHFVYFVKVSTQQTGNARKVQRIRIVARIPREGRGAPGLGGDARGSN